MHLGHLRTEIIPLVPQRLFDDLLGLVDIALVRGEDSLMRALWSRLPLVWQPYREADGGHLGKLAAFEAFYTRGWDDCTTRQWRALSRAWNNLAPLRAPRATRTRAVAPLRGWPGVHALERWRAAATVSADGLRARANGFDELLAMIGTPA